jgi:hypothetical protein
LAEAWEACPDGKLIPHERPDWLFETSEGRIGIEVTELRYKPDSRGLIRQEEEGARKKVCRLLRGLLKKQNYPTVRVSISFRQYYGLARGSPEDALSKQNARDLADQIADIALQHLPPQGKITQIPLHGTSLAKHVRCVRIFRLYDYNAIECVAMDGGIVAALTPEIIQRALESKDRKRKNGYEETFDDYWLLLHTGYAPFSRYFDFRYTDTKETLQHTFETGFDRVFVVDTDDEAAYPLTLRK